MAYLKMFVLVLAAMIMCHYVSAGISGSSCPPKNKVYNNKPTCHSDADCQKYGQVCCPNQYNTKSCTPRAPWRAGDVNSARTNARSVGQRG